MAAQNYLTQARQIEGQDITIETSEVQETRKWLAREVVCKATRGDRVAQYQLAMWYGEGQWAIKDLQQKKWFLEVSGSPDSGEDLYYSPGYNGAPATVTPYPSRTPNPGYAEAQYELGRMYLMGDGVKRSNRRAKKWLERAAEQGHENAKKLLKGIEG